MFDLNRYALVQIAESNPDYEELEVFDWIVVASEEEATAIGINMGYSEFGVSTEDEVTELGIVDRS